MNCIQYSPEPVDRRRIWSKKIRKQHPEGKADRCVPIRRIVCFILLKLYIFALVPRYFSGFSCNLQEKDF